MVSARCHPATKISASRPLGNMAFPSSVSLSTPNLLGCISCFANTGSIHGVHIIHGGLGGVRRGRKTVFLLLYFRAIAVKCRIFCRRTHKLFEHDVLLCAPHVSHNVTRTETNYLDICEYESLLNGFRFVIISV